MPGLSPIQGWSFEARFDGALVSSDGGLLVLRDIEQRMGRAMLDHYRQSFRQVPRRIVLDVDGTFDAVHGGQQLRLFNAHYDDYGFQRSWWSMATAA